VPNQPDISFAWRSDDDIDGNAKNVFINFGHVEKKMYSKLDEAGAVRAMNLGFSENIRRCVALDFQLAISARRNVYVL
jgi:hypothetical protein